MELAMDPILFGVLLGIVNGVYCWAAKIRRWPNLFYMFLIFTLVLYQYGGRLCDFSY